MRKVRRIETYMFSDTVTLVANTAGQLIFSVNQGWDFKLTEFTYKSVVNNANTIPTFNFLIQENENKKMQNRVPNEHFAGVMTEISTAPDTRYVMGLTNPYRMPKPILFPEKSDITVDMEDTSGINNTVTFTLIGIKIIYAFN